MAGRRRWTDEQILAAIRAAAAGAETLRLLDYEAWRRRQPVRQPSATMGYARWGSWSGALAAAGLEPGPVWPGRRVWDEVAIYGALRAAAEQCGRPLRVRDYREWRRGLPDRLAVPTDPVVAERCGGWRAAVRAAGVD